MNTFQIFKDKFLSQNTSILCPISQGLKWGQVMIFLCLASRYADTKVCVRSWMVSPRGGGVVMREHDQNPVQVHDLFFILGSCYLSKFFVEVENRSS